MDLYLNDEYQGNYLLCQAIDLNSGSIDIGNGILVEKDFPAYFKEEPNGFTINEELDFSIKAPSIISQQEIDSIKNYFATVDSLLRDGNPDYNSYLDVESVAKNYLIDELALKSDTGITSTFFYKANIDDILHMGPVWDFDGSFGESQTSWTNFNNSVLDVERDIYLDWYRLLYQNDSDYRNCVVDIFNNTLPYLDFLLT